MMSGEVWQTNPRPVDEHPFARSHLPQPTVMPPYRGTVFVSHAQVT